MHIPNRSDFRGHAVLAALALSLLAGCASAPPVPPAPAPAAPAAVPTPLPAAVAPAPATAPAAAAPEVSQAQREQAFAQWVADFRAEMRARGIGESTLRDAFDQVQFQPRVVELDRAQPEFTRPVWEYLDGAASPQRISRGQQKLAEVRPQAEAAAARYGVPPTILVAIWGVESNFGSNYGSIPTIDALATLAFDGRRRDWARGELLAALRIIDSGDIDHARMVGSWAGAMGQTQFMPSNFLTYAVDADGDGRRDIWGSMADVMASTANYLARSGWKAGQPWGVEVRLPAGFDYARADAALRQTSAQWASEGVRTIDGRPLPAFDESAILLPAGARGPAFLVGPNFRTILRYNNSDSYALAVALLAQRIGGGPGVQAAWPREVTTLTRSQLRALQTALNERGFASGEPDGTMGPATRGALRRFQLEQGLPADGYPTTELLQRLVAP
ncbi:lytic murein transglycosylase [Variovorax sp. J22P168]|uniref:lytic murein transglycosylase n=1 Tax=Variovorax jilinensis TaxID=3053513 RepID=UPI002576DD4F|nr:lytic murein transglycosylase [Variovorax sp. J22P168]MDM0014552.1 lytic murein transglycosylase [Variovorax sp. J22P168]